MIGTFAAGGDRRLERALQFTWQKVGEARERVFQEVALSRKLEPSKRLWPASPRGSLVVNFYEPRSTGRKDQMPDPLRASSRFASRRTGFPASLGFACCLHSLARAEPGCAVILFCPFADENFIRFAAGLTEISVEIRTVSPPGAYSWNVKPQALLELLNEGADEVVWIDSDIIVSSRFIQRLSALDTNMIVVTEEALWGGADDNERFARKALGFQRSAGDSRSR